MSRLSGLWRNLLRRDRVERELDDEIRATLDQLIEEKIEAGVRPDQARRLAMLELGGVESVKEQIRDERPGALVESWLQDLRYALRLLRHNPLFTLTASLSLAIGIGATTAIFTVANGLLLRAAEGVAEPGRLVDLVRRVPGSGPGVEMMSFPDLLEVRRRATTLETVYGYQLQLLPVSLRFSDGLTPAFANLVTTNYFHALGVQAAAGRLFDPGDREDGGAAPVAVLSHHFWLRRFNGDRGIVGTTVRINNEPLTIVGVAAEGFKGLSVATTDVWLPVSLIGAISQEGRGIELRSVNVPWLMLGARLRPGVSRAQASAEIAAIGVALLRERPDVPTLPPPFGAIDIKASSLVWSAEGASPIPYGMRTIAAAFVAVLMAMVSIVLIIACANLAGVLLARATMRRREIAVRTAVGAGRARLIRQLLTETAALFVLGGAAGLALARGLTTLLVALLPSFPMPVSLSVPLDARVVVFATVLSFVAAVLSGLAPALHASRTDVVTALKDDSQGPLDRRRLRNAFVVVQVAFSILLVVVAGLLARGLDGTLSRSRGFEARAVDIASVDLVMAGHGPASGPQSARRILERIRQIPGVVSATLADRAPGDGARILGQMTVPGVVPPDGRTSFTPNWMLVETGYFETLRIPLMAGRDFTQADVQTTEPVAIIGAAAARRFWPAEDPIGRQVLVTSSLRPREGPPPPPTAVRIVGVAGDVVADGTPLTLYVPFQQRYMSQITFLARHDDRRPRLTSELRAAIETAESGLPVLTASTLERADNPAQVQLRIAATVAGSVGIVGLLLAGIGIYGVTAYAVAQRTREIGIRLSLGASHTEVAALVLRQGMTLVGIGSVIGLVLAIGAGRLLAGQRFGIPQADPLTLVAATLVFILVGLGACYVPVRRAVRIRATEALRYE